MTGSNKQRNELTASETGAEGAIPRVPTQAMLIAARDWSVKRIGTGIGNDATIGCWQAMYDAAPFCPPAMAAEPVAWRYLTPTGWHATTNLDRALGASAHHDMEPLYAAPQTPAQADAREGLTIPDGTRALLLNVLWHHQGGSSAVGQPIRKILGIGEYDHLSGDQLTEAKRIEQLVANEPMENVIQRENDRLRADLKRRTDIEKGHFWYWIGDGCDALESLTCQVIIKAADLRALLAAHPGQPEPRVEVTDAMIDAAIEALGPCVGSCGEASPPQRCDIRDAIEAALAALNRSQS